MQDELRIVDALRALDVADDHVGVARLKLEAALRRLDVPDGAERDARAQRLVRKATAVLSNLRAAQTKIAQLVKEVTNAD